MDRDLAHWNCGMGDAEAGRLAASGGSRDYYDGYYYACAVDYEYVGVLPEFAGERDDSPLSRESAGVTASDFRAQLDRLNSRLLDGSADCVQSSAGG